MNQQGTRFKMSRAYTKYYDACQGCRNEAVIGPSNINNTRVPLFIGLLILPILLKCHITDPCTFMLLIIVVASFYATMFSSHY